MDWILAMKRGQVFPIILIGGLFSILTIEGYPQLTLVTKILGAIFYALWPLLVANELQHLLPKKVQLNFNFFLANTFIWLAFLFGSIIIIDGSGMRFTGVEVIPVIYVIFAYCYYLAFPAKILNSIEKQRTANLGEYIGDFFLVLFLPIGIWFLQPRINKVFAKHTIDRLEKQQLEQNSL